MGETIRFGSRGQGSLIKFDGSANWHSRYSIRGQEHVQSTGTSDLKLAKRIHRQTLDELAADRQGHRRFLPPIAQRVTIAELLRDLEADYRLRHVKSWAQVQSHVKPIREHFGDWRASDVTPEAVDGFIEERLEAGKAGATVNRETQLLTQAMRLALERHKITTIPSIRQLPEQNARQGFFERPEFEAVVVGLPQYLRDLCRFAFLTGWRRGEIISLTWSDVDRDGGAIRLRPEASKNGRGRTVMLGGDLAVLIERRFQARLLDHGPVVRVTDRVFHRDGEPIGDFRKAWSSACVKAGLYMIARDPSGAERKVPDKLFHDLRRTAVRNMIRAGVPERVAMEVSGHRTRAIFDRYNIVSERDLQEAMQRTTEYLTTVGSKV